MRQVSYLLLIALAPWVVTSQPAGAAKLKTLWVGPQMVDCVGVGPQRCLQVKESQYDEWSLFYDRIEGFDWEQGYGWELLVVEKPIPDPPADAPSVRLVLVEVLSKVEAWADPDLPISPPPPPTPPPAVLAERPPESASPRRETTENAAHRGYLTIGYGLETRSFKPCGGEEPLWVEDATGRDLWTTYRRLAGTPQRPLYVVLRGRLEGAPATGFGANYSRRLVATELRHAAAESAGCAQDLSGFEFVASGSEPFWGVKIGPGGIAFSELGAEGRLLFPREPPEGAGGGILYRGATAGDNPHRIEVSIVEEPCAGTMVDAVYSHRALVTLDGRELSGCALAGPTDR